MLDRPEFGILWNNLLHIIVVVQTVLRVRRTGWLGRSKLPLTQTTGSIDVVERLLLQVDLIQASVLRVLLPEQVTLYLDRWSRLVF